MHRHRDIYVGSFVYLRTVMSHLATAVLHVLVVDRMGYINIVKLTNTKWQLIVLDTMIYVCVYIYEK